MGEGNYNLNSVDVVKWQQGSKDNNCYWNIALNQLEQKNGSATAAEVKALADQIQQETEARNSAIANRNGILYEGDQIFIPLEYAMDEIQANIGAITEQVTQASSAYKDASSKLSDANSNLADALSAYKTAQAAYDPEADGADDSELNAAKQAYLDALQEQQNAAKEAQTAQEELTKAQEELSSAKTQYQELVDEYDGEKESFQAELDEVTQQIEASETELSNLEQEYSAAETKAQLEEAEKSKAAAESIGVTQGEDGTFMLEGEPDKEALQGALSELGYEAAAGSVQELGIEDDINKLLASTSMDAEGLEFVENENGTYTAELMQTPDESESMNRSSYKNVFTYNPETGEVSYKTYNVTETDGDIEDVDAWEKYSIYDPENETTTTTSRYTRITDEASGEVEETIVEYGGNVYKTEETFNGVTTKWEYDTDGNLISEQKFNEEGIEIDDNGVPLSQSANVVPETSDGLIDGLANLEAENEWLRDSDYYQNLANQIRTSLSDTNATLTLVEKQDLYKQIQDFNSHMAEFNGIADVNSESYNELITQNFSSDYFTYLYESKIAETGSEEEAYNAVNQFISDASSLIDIKNETDAMYEQVLNLYRSDDLSPVQKLLLNDVVDEYTFDSTTNHGYYLFNQGGGTQSIICNSYTTYNISEQERDSTIRTYEMYQEQLQPMFDAIDIEAKTSDWKEEDPKYELMNLYNDFVSNHQGNFKGDDKKAKEYAESVLRMYLSGAVSTNSVETAIQNLKNRMNA